MDGGREETIIGLLTELRTKLSPDQLRTFDELMRTFLNAKSPFERVQMMDALVDPERVLSRAERDNILGDAVGDELAPRRLRRGSTPQRRRHRRARSRSAAHQRSEPPA